MSEERSLKVLLSPHISEKTSTPNGEYAQFAFKVLADATKPEIREAVETLFNTKVRNVRVSNVKPKTKRHGRTTGKRQGWKKAYVVLEKDQDIDLGVNA